MRDKAVSGVMLILLLFSVLFSMFSIQPVDADPSIIIVPDDYEKIQWGIGNASDGDTVFVRAGTYYENVIVNKTVILEGEDRETTIIDGGGIGSVVSISFANVVVGGFSLRNSGSNSGDSGILVYLSVGNVIFNNIVTNNTYGISLVQSLNNSVYENIITENERGIDVFHNGSNIIRDNTIVDNTGLGLCFFKSSGNNVHCNIISNNGYSSVSIDKNSQNNMVYDNIIANSFYGVSLYSITALEYLILNIIRGNNITNNYFGIGINGLYVYDNMIYHNNFIGNTIQVDVINDASNVWDNGYPSGGNYWSNYAGVDVKSGPNQDQPGSDSLADAEYVIDANNIDHYPLMNPFPCIHAIKTGGLECRTLISQGFTVRVYVDVTNQGHFFETFNVTAYAGTILIGTQTNVILASWDSATLTFTWDTTGFAYGNYTISANATVLQEETEVADNTYVDGQVLVTIPGDVDGDRVVDVIDQRKVQLAMFTTPASPRWNPNADIDCDEVVDVIDQRNQQLHMFESW